jgi:hypothetical protein
VCSAVGRGQAGVDFRPAPPIRRRCPDWIWSAALTCGFAGSGRHPDGEGELDHVDSSTKV